jgi:hypothetical protein
MSTGKRYRKSVEPTNFLLAFLIGIAVFLFVLGMIFTYDLNQKDSIILALVMIVVYVFLLMVLLNPKRIEEIYEREIQRIEVPVIKTVIKEVEVEKPVFRDVVRTVEKPVIREVIKEVPVIKRIFVERPKKKAIPQEHFEYVGSTEEKTYHHHTCRFSKLIKKKYLLKNNNAAYFKARKFKKCKMCMGPKKTK